MNHIRNSDKYLLKSQSNTKTKPKPCNNIRDVQEKWLIVPFTSVDQVQGNE